jgi:hypothetical protein
VRKQAQRGPSEKPTDLEIEHSSTIRIDESAARATYRAALNRRLLILALARPKDGADISDIGSAVLLRQQEIETAERALLHAAATFEALTSSAEAAAVFALYAASAQHRNPKKKGRGRPAMTEASQFDVKLANVVLDMQKIYPNISRNIIFENIAAMVKDGVIQFDRAFPADGVATEVQTIVKRLERSYALAMKHRPPPQT